MKLFICDYVGTFDGTNNRISELKKFFSLLDQLTGDEQMMFSFATTNSLKDLEKCLLEVEQYKSEKIFLGPQYGGDAYLDENHEIIVKNVPYKIENIRSLLEKCRQSVTTIYYADDTLILQKMMLRIIREYNFEYEAFMPGGSDSRFNCSSKKGLTGLNEAITTRLSIGLDDKKLS